MHTKKYNFLLLPFICLCLINGIKAQVANYVNNGSFEATHSRSVTSGFDVISFWGPTDTTKSASFLFTKLPPRLSSPYCSTGFQYPRSGNNFILSQFYCTNCVRWYPRNRLKQNLKPNTVYCAKYYVVNTNNNRVGIDSYGMFFGDASLDTIKRCDIPLVYLNPQVQNLNGIITDTLNWIAVSGTFVATGTEKHVMLGNFKSNAATNTVLLNPALPLMSNDVYIDDVSVIELNLPAYAGDDKPFIAGDSVFIGREPDFAIDSGCVWYQLPLTTPIATISGLWVKPVTTTTYVVRQELDCSPLKWDTVVVYQTALGLNEMNRLNEALKIFPVPADEILNFEFHPDSYRDENGFATEVFNIAVYNNLGQLLREEDITFKNKQAKISTSDLANGVYFIRMTGEKGVIVNRKFVVSR